MWVMVKAHSPEPKVVEELLSRGVEHIYPSKEFLQQKLLKGGRARLYFGVDPTGPTLHLGHATILLKLKKLQALGHEIILLIGDFTGMIGDPTDKSAARTRLTHKEVLHNAKQYKKQASHFLSFSGKNPAKLLYNAAWLSKLKFEEVLDLAAHFTTQQLLERDMFQARLRDGKPIYLHEFLYPLMQGYDSVAMKVDGEIGGNDQTFNMLAGRTLIKQVAGKEKFVIAMKLLVDPSGKKMGKTEGNMVTLEDSPAQCFGKVMSWPDEMLWPGFEIATDVAVEEIEKIKKMHPKDAKMRLAREIVTLLTDERAAEQAEKEFIKTFREKKAPDSIPEIQVSKDTPLVLALAGQLGSNSRARQYVQQGAISEIGGEKILDPFFPITHDIDLRIGAHEFVRIKVI